MTGTFRQKKERNNLKSSDGFYLQPDIRIVGVVWTLTYLIGESTTNTAKIKQSNNRTNNLWHRFVCVQNPIESWHWFVHQRGHHVHQSEKRILIVHKQRGKKKVHSYKPTRQKIHHYRGCSYTTILYLLWHQIGWQICRFDIGHQGKKRHRRMCFLDKFTSIVCCLVMSRENLWRSSDWEVTHS